MSAASAYKFDSLSYADFLTENGCNPDLAKAQAGEMVKIIDFLQTNVSVSKKDIQRVENLTRDESQAIRHDIAEIHKEIANIHQKIAESDTKTQLHIAELRCDLQQTQTKIIMRLGSLVAITLGVGLAILGLLIKGS